MQPELRALLEELAAFGRAHDAREPEHARRMLNITPDTGARRILEIGTSNAYSTIWLAWAATRTDGHVTTVERSAEKAVMARANLTRAGLLERVTLCQGAALDVLPSLPGPFDFIFLDADRPNYLAYLDLILPRLRPGGLLVTDNAVSHAAEMDAYLARLRSDPRLASVTVPIGNGEELTYKRS